MKTCCGCSTRKAAADFSAGAWKRTQARTRLCLVCARNAHGLWTCSKRNVKKATVCFQQWTSQHRAQNGQQVCDSCQGPKLERSVVKKAVARVAATHVKVARQKHERVMAEVVAEIARKRKDEGDATQERKCKALRAQEQRNAPQAASPVEVQPHPTEKLRKEAATKPFQYVCPFCQVAVGSTVSSGQVNHRNVCGNRFQVKDGHVTAKDFVYTCPFCEGTVASKLTSGQIDHRGMCGNQFYVQDGQVAAKEYVYTCPFCDGTVASKLRTGRVNHGGTCGKRFCVENGVVSKGTKQHAHRCPLCRTLVWSARASGRIQSKHKAPCGRPCKQKSWIATERSN